jgi:hypothetical protein
VARGEDVLLETGIHFGRIRQYALEQRRRDGDHFQAVTFRQGCGLIHFLVGEIDDVLAG